MLETIVEVFRKADRGSIPERISYINDYLFELEGMQSRNNPQGTELNREGDTIFHDKTQYERISGVCTDFLAAAKAACDDPFPALDLVFSNLVAFKLSPELSEETITERAHDLLRRMPEHPLSLAEIQPGFYSRCVFSLGSHSRGLT